MAAVAARPLAYEQSSQPGSSSASTFVSRAERIQLDFDGYRSEIDTHNDRRERLIKASRDITNLSKKLIFHLHRIPPPLHLSASSDSPSSGKPEPPKGKMWHEALQKRDEIIRLIQRVAYEEGLGKGSEASLRYERNLGGGVEEFVSRHRIHVRNRESRSLTDNKP